MTMFVRANGCGREAVRLARGRRRQSGCGAIFWSLPFVCCYSCPRERVGGHLSCIRVSIVQISIELIEVLKLLIRPAINCDDLDLCQGVLQHLIKVC